MPICRAMVVCPHFIIFVNIIKTIEIQNSSKNETLQMDGTATVMEKQVGGSTTKLTS